ncbi:MAG TPA: ABC transporter substrate-binding protein [Pseudonocardiaceae bacterium]|nr:ABC transporter substrate-binding protein [Pseudonocardiaceae bacterium]
MSATRAALLIGCSDYEDPKFPQLPTSVEDVDALTRVLGDRTISDFTVDTRFNEPPGEVSERIEAFFVDRKPDDLLLLYFSCHGVLDSRGRLYFVTAKTKKDLLDSTGISARRVKEQMDHSRSQRIVLLLDCCYSGAFSGGLTRRSAGAEEILEQLGGRGRVVITASDKMQYAYESKFTDAVVRGLKTGAADLDGDGRVSVCELYQYVYDQVRQDTPDQTPTMSADGMRGQIYLAKNPQEESPLPAELEQLLTSEIVWERLWAVDGLRRLLAGGQEGGQKRKARQVLLRLRDDRTDLGMQAAASEALRRVSRRPDVPHPRRRFDRRLVGVGLTLAAMLGIGISVPLAVGDDMPVPCSPSVKPADGVLSLGTLLTKTGVSNYTSPPLSTGVHLAMKDINDAGGIPGMVVKLDEANQRDEGDPSADIAETAGPSTDALLDGEVDAIVGPMTSAVALKVIDKVVYAGVIMFLPTNASPLFTTHPDRGLYFRIMPSTALEGSVLGKLVVDDGNSTAVVMSRDDPYGNYLREDTVKAIQESGGRILESFHYNPDALDHGKDIQRVKAMNPDAIVLIGFTERARMLGDMIKEGIGPRSKRVYGSNMTNTLTGQVDPRNSDVLMGMRGTMLDAGDETFLKRLTETNPGLRDLNYAAQAHDAVVITALAAAVAGTDAPAAIAKEINGVTKIGEKCASFAACMTLVKDHKDIDYDGPSGPLEFTDPGEPNSATYVISEIQADGTVKALRSVRVGPPG